MGVPPPGCTNPVPPFDAAGVRCILDAFIADAPAHLQVGYHDPISQYATFHDYVLFGDGTVSDEQTGHQDLGITCNHVPGTLRDKAYLTTCKASTTDADLFDCFQAAVQWSAPGPTCTNHLGGCNPMP